MHKGSALLVVLIVLAVLGAAGYYYWQHGMPAAEPVLSTSASTTPDSAEATTTIRMLIENDTYRLSVDREAANQPFILTNKKTSNAVILKDAQSVLSEEVTRTITDDGAGAYVAFDSGTDVMRGIAIYSPITGEKIASFCALHGLVGFWLQYAIYESCDHEYKIPVMWEAGVPDILARDLKTGAITVLASGSGTDGPTYLITDSGMLKGLTLGYISQKLTKRANGYWDMEGNPVVRHIIPLAEVLVPPSQPVSATLPFIRVTDIVPEGPALMTVQYWNLPKRASFLTLCSADTDACTDWGETFTPDPSGSGTFVMGAAAAAEGSKKGIGSQSYHVVVGGTTFADQITASQGFYVP